LTLFLTVALGALVGVVIVAQTLYASTTEHLTDFGTVKALGGGNLTVYGIIAEQASYAAALGCGLALALAFTVAPVLARLDMKMIVSPTRAGLVYVGTQVRVIVTHDPRVRLIADRVVTIRDGRLIPAET
jgi:putative ABC transport system permease protein